MNVARILSDLIAFPSVSSESNLPILDYVSEFLERRGVKSTRIPAPDGEKASLLATVGPPDRPGVVLSAHTDVVPVEGQNWSSPPFEATERQGRIYGRGTADMKGFLAVVLAHVDLFKSAATTTPVHLAFSYDEEVGCRGAPDLAAAVAALPTKPAACIVGEPTSLRVVHAHKGKGSYRVTVKGRGGHSALPHRAANAVTTAARIAVALADIAAELERSAESSSPFDPPWTTVHVGSLHGGTALNLVPDLAALEFEIRNTPDTHVPDVIAEIEARVASARVELQARASEGDVTIERVAAYPALGLAGSDPLVTAITRLSGSAEAPGAVSFGTEAGIYAAAGIPSVVCGPGDIARAHKADEWIGLDELAAAGRMMERLAARLHEPAETWIRP